jgi:hypothetical protein
MARTPISGSGVGDRHGIHPEDAIRLVKEGWEVDATGKSYKRYLNPPGTKTSLGAAIAGIRAGREPGQGVPSVWSPGPPVKLYVAHFSDADVKTFNEALAAQTKSTLPE